MPLFPSLAAIRTPRGSVGKSISLFSPCETAAWVPRIFTQEGRRGREASPRSLWGWWTLTAGFPRGPGRSRTAKSRQGEPRPRLPAQRSGCRRELSRLRCGPKVAPASPRRPGPHRWALEEGPVLCCKSLLRPALLLGVNE